MRKHISFGNGRAELQVDPDDLGDIDQRAPAIEPGSGPTAPPTRSGALSG